MAESHESASRVEAHAGLHRLAMVGVTTRWDDPNRVVAIRYKDTGEWGFPTRPLRYNESFWQCVQRAVRETTSLPAGVPYLRAVYRDVVHPAGLITMIWRIEHAGGEPVATGEASEAAWLTREEAIECMSEIDGRSVDRALNVWDEFAIDMEHDGTQFIRY